MKIAPIIHSRTLYRDFNPNFAVRPKDLNVDWAMSKILPSTRDIDILDGVRRMFATDGKICIAGIACNFKMFAEKFLSAEEHDAAKKYFHDERGREIKVFLGYVFKDSGVPDVSDSKLWQMFEKYFALQWELQNPETVIAPYEDCSVKSVAKRPFDKNFYPSNERDDIELFEQCIATRKNFCSNVDAVKIAEDGKYEIITAAQGVINRLQEAEAQKKNSYDYPPRQPRQVYGTTFSSTTHAKPETLKLDRKDGLFNTDNYKRNSSRNIGGDSILRDESSVGGKRRKTFTNIDELCSDINRNYDGVIFHDDLNGTYRLANIGKLDFKGTLNAISDYLTASYRDRNVKLILLIAEETDE